MSLRRDYEDSIVAELRRWPGASLVEIGHAGKHAFVRVGFGGASRKVFFPASPSDSLRGVLNMMTDLRAELRTLGARREDPVKAAHDPRRSRMRAPLRGLMKVEIGMARDPWAPLAGLLERMRA